MFFILFFIKRIFCFIIWYRCWVDERKLLLFIFLIFMWEFKMFKGWWVKWIIFILDNWLVFFRSFGDRWMVLMICVVVVLYVFFYWERYYFFLLLYIFFLCDFYVCFFFRIDLYCLLYLFVKWKIVKFFRIFMGSLEIW